MKNKLVGGVILIVSFLFLGLALSQVDFEIVPFDPGAVEAAPVSTPKPGEVEFVDTWSGLGLPEYVGHGSLLRYIDSDAGVVCWVLDIDRGGGLSCLPLAETMLGGQ